MIVLISPENDIPNELNILHQLFKEGLTHYHFRKPNKTKSAYCEYLDQIDPKYLQYVVLHNHQELATQYAVRGLHLEEKKWREKGDNLPSFVAHYKKQGLTVSSSYHEQEDLEKQPVAFDYYILSPVFGAISKPGYEGRGFNVTHIQKLIVGMGGINAKSTPEALKLGFKGVGALGGIWNNNDPIASFKELKVVFEATLKTFQ